MEINLRSLKATQLTDKVGTIGSAKLRFLGFRGPGPRVSGADVGLGILVLRSRPLIRGCLSRTLGRRPTLLARVGLWI